MLKLHIEGGKTCLKKKEVRVKGPNLYIGK